MRKCSRARCARSSRRRASISNGSARPSASQPAETDAIVQWAMRLASSSKSTGKVSYGTEAGLFQQMGVPTVILGPGDIAEAHRPNEFVALEQLAQCEAFHRPHSRRRAIRHDAREPAEPGVKIVKGACPHDCPGHLRARRTCQGRRRLEGHGLGRACARPPACSAPKSRATPSEPTTPIGCCIRCGASARRGRGASSESAGRRRSRRIAARLAAIAAEDPEQILPYSYAGTMGLVQGESMAQRFFHRLGASLLDRTICASAGSAGHNITLGPEHRHRCGVGRGGAAHHLLGMQRHHLERAFLGARAGSEAPRRAAHRHRSLPLAHGREMSPAHRAAAGDRWRARARPDARADPRRSHRPRLRAPPYAGLRGAPRARARLRPGARGRRSAALRPARDRVARA